VAEAKVTFRAEVGNLIRGVRQAQLSFDALHNTVRDNWWGIQNVGTAFAGVGAAIAAGAGAAVKAAAQFESGMVGVARTTRAADQTAEEAVASIGPLGDQLRELALIRPVGLDRIISIAEQAGALGVAKDDVADFTKTIVDLVSATNLTDQSATQLARIGGVMEIPAAQFGNLGSAILEAGRSTAATEQEIVNFSTRLASSAKIANLTAGELVAVSAASLSLGSRAEAGASALQRTLGNMAQAIASGGQDLQAFATVAGVSTKQFSDTFRNDGLQALTLFVEGLNSLGDDSVKVTSALNAVGITEVRQIKAMQELAAGVKSTVNPMLDLRNAQAAINAAYTDGNALTDAAAQVNETAAAKFTMAKNAIKDAGIVLGSIFLPAIKPVADFVGNFAAGIGQLPAPLRYVVTGLTLAAGAFAAIAGAILLIGPRLILVRGAFTALRDGILGAAAAEGEEAAAASAGAAANTRLAAAKGAVATTAEAAAGAVMGLAAAEGREAGTATAAAGSNARLTGSNTAVRGSALLAAEAMYLEAQAAGAVAGASAAAIPGLAGYAGASTVAGTAAGGAAARTGLLAGTMGVLRGSAGKLGGALAKLKSPYALAAAATLGMIAYTAHQGKQARETAGATDGLSKSLKDQYSSLLGATDGTDDLTSAQNDAAQAAKNLSDAIREQNQGLDAMYEAQLSAREALLNLAEAEDDLRAARADAASNADEVADATNDLKKAQLDAAEAAAKIADAQRALNTARRDQLEDLAASERDLADARDSYEESLRKVADAQEALNALQSGPSADDLRDATNKLANAQLGLRDAGKKAADAQWYLNYLMEEGASSRDIEDARDALASANQDVADATDAAIDAQAEYNDLITVTPEERAAAERDYQEALRDSEDALQSVKDAEREVAELRRDVAADTAYKKALADLVDAQSDAAQAAQDLRDAQKALADARKGGDDARTVAKAELDYEQALYRVAEAQAQAEIASRRARGEHIGAAEEAQILAKHLRDVGRQASGPARKGMEDYAAALSGMRDEVEQSVADANAALANLGKIPPGNLDFLDELNKDLEEGTKEGGKKAGKGLVESAVDWLEENAGELIVGALVTALVGLTLPVSAPVALIAGLAGIIASALYGLLPDSFQDAVGRFVKDIPHYLAEAGRAIGDFFTDTLPDFFGGLPETIGGAFSGMGEWIGGALDDAGEAIEGWVGDAGDFFADLPGNVVDGISGLPGALTTFFAETLPYAAGQAIGFLLTAMYESVVGSAQLIGDIAVYVATTFWDGLVQGAEALWDFGGAVVTFLTETLPNAIEGMRVWMRELIIQGWDAFTGALRDTWDLRDEVGRWFTVSLPGALSSAGRFMQQLPGRMWSAFTSAARGVWNFVGFLGGLIQGWITALPGQLRSFGEWLGRTIWNGVTGALSLLGRAAGNFFRGIFDALPNGARDAVNDLIGLINGFLRMLNSIRITLPTYQLPFGGPKIGGQSFGFPLIQVPYIRAARGAIIDSPTMALMGEAGAEAVIPLRHLYDSFASIDAMAMVLRETNMALQTLIANTATGGAGAGGDNFYLTALTDADAVEIAEEFMWAKMIRSR
jgi:TP901 family phage tail tape measure protein